MMSLEKIAAVNTISMACLRFSAVYDIPRTKMPQRVILKHFKAELSLHGEGKKQARICIKMYEDMP